MRKFSRNFSTKIKEIFYIAKNARNFAPIMTHIEAILDFCEKEMPAYFAQNKPDYANKKDRNLIDLKRCQMYQRYAKRIQAGQPTDWKPSAQAVAQLLEDFAPGVYTVEITAVFTRNI